MSRTTTDKKDHVIKLRVNDETKDYLEKRAKQTSVTVSEYVRQMIDKDRLERNRKERERRNGIYI